MKDAGSDSFYLYGLASSANADKIRYIGYASDIEKRFSEHLRDANRTLVKTHKKYWIKKELSIGNQIEVVVLDSAASSEEIKRKEIAAILLFKSFGANLVNGTMGGDGVVCTDEVRKRIGRKGAVVSIETRRKISLAQTGKRLPESQKKKIGDSLRGRPGIPLSEETKKKLSISLMGKPSPMKGKVLSEERRLFVSQLRTGTISPLRKKILQFGLNGVFIKEWPCISIAKKELNIPNIGKSLSGKRTHAGGFIWKYQNNTL